VSDYRQSLQFKNLNAEKQNIQLEVIRGGRTIKLSIFDIVVGDVVPLKIGDQVPADGVLITGHSLAIDESSMTGESKIVQKDHKAPFLMSGCKVADGVGTMLITGVGINTEWGLLMASISEDNGEETPLQVRLNGVATFVGIVGLTVAASVLAVLLGRYFSGNTKDEDGQVQFVAGKTSIDNAVDGVIKIFTIAVTIVVVAVPEGLPLAVTLTLAYSMRKMMADKALVRRLSACETMGSATTICSDKTGTLTLNQMTVVEAYAGRKKLDPPDDSSKLHPEVLSLINEGIAQNTTGNVFVPKDGGETEISGSPTEKAILSWATKLGMNFELTRSSSTILHVFPFNSEKKRGGVALKLGASGVHIHWKGAAEIVLGACTQYLDSNGQLQSIEKDKAFFMEAIEDMAVQSLRCVAIAYRPYELDEVPSKQEDLDKWSLPEQELVLLAIVGIKDPCRPGVEEAVRLCSQAGVKVRMVTGDNLNTAKAIALECGILSSREEAVEPNIIEGKKFRELSEIEREQVAKKITVMGRSSPNDKLLLVQALRKLGEVVAVTGDGTNDAPALHEADIGLSMGIQGTEVAKESSDIIILDDNFASVVKVVRWGRSVYANIQKFIQFQLTVNVAALVINVVAAVSAGEVPLNAVQLLWVNLIMDTLGALALATEPPTDSLMRRSPVGRRESLITNVMWRNLIVQAIYQVTVLLVLNFGWQSINLEEDQDSKSHSLQVKNTLIFNTFVLCQIFNEFNARKIDEMYVFKGVTKNRLFMGIVGVTFVLQILIIEFLGKFTSTVRLNWKLWLFSLGIGIFSWPLAVLGKLIPVPKTPWSRTFKKHIRRLKKSRSTAPAQQQ
ncbi:Calcium-transporting ATPase 9, plasma membrane-type, partial [Stylosanthes scabra]|nr:Calcium-transporting ATPase 9, plasma membrane-type [Stylosanthes scabra]